MPGKQGFTWEQGSREERLSWLVSDMWSEGVVMRGIEVCIAKNLLTPPRAGLLRTLHEYIPLPQEWKQIVGELCAEVLLNAQPGHMKIMKSI